MNPHGWKAGPGCVIKCGFKGGKEAVTSGKWDTGNTWLIVAKLSLNLSLLVWDEASCQRKSLVDKVVPSIDTGVY